MPCFKKFSLRTRRWTEVHWPNTVTSSEIYELRYLLVGVGLDRRDNCSSVAGEDSWWWLTVLTWRPVRCHHSHLRQSRRARSVNTSSATALSGKVMQSAPSVRLFLCNVLTLLLLLLLSSSSSATCWSPRFCSSRPTRGATVSYTHLTLPTNREV